MVDSDGCNDIDSMNMLSTHAHMLSHTQHMCMNDMLINMLNELHSTCVKLRARLNPTYLAWRVSGQARARARGTTHSAPSLKIGTSYKQKESGNIVPLPSVGGHGFLSAIAPNRKMRVYGW